MATVFFSWQSDQDFRTGRALIEKALERAISKISEDMELFEPDREGGMLTLDRDTKGVAGSPPVVEAIFRKIDSAAVFVPDLTFVGTRADRRPTPNPNVLIEYGWALKALGHSRIVGVMNTAYGEPDGENMPFDIRHQLHPIKYFCQKGAQGTVRAAAVESLTNDFVDALRAVFKSGEFRESVSGEISNRLNRLLEQVNADRHEKIRPSHVAQRLGEERAEEVEGWFLGKQNPTFSQLSAIAELFGVEEKWVQHGDGHIYKVGHKSLPRNSIEALKWLVDWDGEDDKLEVLHLIRAMDDTGGLCVVKESKRGNFKIYHTSIHVSEEIGASGEADLKHLFVTLEMLYGQYTNGGYGFRVVGHQITRDDVLLLVRGNTNPSLFLNKGLSSWWEDIWDEKMNGGDYWPGYRALRDRIVKCIALDARLTMSRENIRRGVATHGAIRETSL